MKLKEGVYTVLAIVLWVLFKINHFTGNYANYPAGVGM